MHTILKFTLTFCGVFGTIALMAQQAPPATPIDGGLSLLLAGATAYGIKKIYDARKG
ncbi:MAG: hypothetical protein RIC35_09065 [Marinoscillum sp.]